jgi:hypothetical protein
VEVTKLSLLLKVLEGENDETINQTLKLFAERALPSLEKNIRCGNSLISPQDLANVFLSAADKKRINAFDWKSDFADVFDEGGFSAVIGNPPYVRIQTMKEWAPLEVELYKHLYAAASSGNYDIYTAFVEKGLWLLRESGRLGFILPHKFFNSQYGKPLRALISNGSHLREVVHFGDLQVFHKATTYTCLLFLTRSPTKIVDLTRVYDLTAWRTLHGGSEHGQITAVDVGISDWDFVTGAGTALYQRLRKQFRTLNAVAEIFVGVQTSADDVYIMDYVSAMTGTIRLQSKALGKVVEIESGILRPIVSGTDIAPFESLPTRQFVLFPYEVDASEKATLIPFNDITRRWPLAAAYLKANKNRLESREKKKFADHEWHRFGRTQNLGIQGRKKLCVPRLVDRLHCTIDVDGGHVLDNVDVGGVTFRAPFASLSLHYLNALLNSRLLQWYFPFVSAPFRGGYQSANRQFLGKLPIAIPDLADYAECGRYEAVLKIEAKLRDLLSSSEALTPHQRVAADREATELRRQLDEVVYQLYGVSHQESSEIAEATIAI